MTHYLVKGDTGSQITALLSRVDTGEPINCTNSTVYLRVRKKGSLSILFTLTGTVSQTPTNQVIFLFGDYLNNLVPGLYEGEIEVKNGSIIQTVYEIIQFQVRAGFN